MRGSPSFGTGIFELEPLEIRRFLTVATADGTTLLITGGSASDTINVTTTEAGRTIISGVYGSDGLLRRFDFGTLYEVIRIIGQGGNDKITIGNTVEYTNSTIDGGAGNDTLTGGQFRDRMEGGTGDDVMEGRGAPDVFLGEDGSDAANYSARGLAMRIDIDNVADDGLPNEGDNVMVTTEEVIGGSGNDLIVGTSAVEFFAGGAGADTIRAGSAGDIVTGSTGSDELFGEAGNDFLQAKNIDRDVVNGGTGDFDSAEIDLDLDTENLVVANLAVQALAFFTTAAITNPSALDTTYGGGDGKHSGPDFGSGDVVSAVGADGSVVFAARGFNEDTNSTDFFVIHYTPDGALDTTFGNSATPGLAIVDFTTDGVTTALDQPLGVGFDAAGRILVVGSTRPLVGEFFGDADVAVARLTGAGVPDATFGNIGGGRTIVDAAPGLDDEGTDVVADDLGRIVVAGSREQSTTSTNRDFLVVRLGSTGAPDAGFSGDGIASIDSPTTHDVATAVALQNFASPDGTVRTIVVGGSRGQDIRLARFDDAGSLESTFGTGGISDVTLGSPATLADLAVGPNNELASVGQFRFPLGTGSINLPLLVAYDVNGNPLDLATETAGQGRYGAVTFDPDGRIVAVGGAVVNPDSGDEDFYVQRYTFDLSDGLALDPSFNGPGTADFTPTDSVPGGNQDDSATSVLVLPSGKIMTGGWSDECNDGCFIPAAARFGADDGDTGNAEIEVTDVEDQTITWDDLHQVPPSPEIAAILDSLSATGRLYVLSQPKDDGSAVIDLGSTNDTVVVTREFDENGVEILVVDVNGVRIPYTLSDTPMITINTGSGADVVEIPQDVTVPFHIFGGAGNDQLFGGGGDDVLDGGAGNDVANGGGGNDLILGQEGTDNLTGEGGRDLVVGGNGADKVNGAAGDDILIAGRTAYDLSNLDALEQILAEWGQPTAYADRVAAITNPAASVFLRTGSGGTVFNDTSKDILTGSLDSDWFFAQTSSGTTKDILMDRQASERVDSL